VASPTFWPIGAFSARAAPLLIVAQLVSMLTVRAAEAANIKTLFFIMINVLNTGKDTTIFL
jgi:hypothetical protein